MTIRQIVRVEILGAYRLYTYGWEFNPADGELPLAVGDEVGLPGNEVSPEGTSGTVAALGSDYTGPMKSIIRRLTPKTDTAGDLWAGEEGYEHGS